MEKLLLKHFPVFILMTLLLNTFGCTLIKKNVGAEENKKEFFNFLLHNTWASDSCGKKGYREKILEYILNGGADKYLLGADTNKILYIFGPPVFRDEDPDQNLSYKYYQSLLQDSKGDCYYTSALEGKGIIFTFSKRKNKLINYYSFTE